MTTLTVDLFTRNDADVEFQRQYSPMLSRLLQRSGQTSVPAGLNPADVARAAQLDAPEQQYELRQLGWDLLLWPRSRPALVPTASRLGLPWRASGVVLKLPPEGRGEQIKPWGEPKPLVCLATQPQCRISVQSREYHVEPLERPAWAQEMGRDDFGVYVDMRLKTGYGRAGQRWRWIEPGTFLMGSPETEIDRSRDEGPQHPVTLTRGFWLADTACTQALWIAVTGANPSTFKGDVQLPVECVSWEDVQAFLRVLEQLLPQFMPALPTEAEWEYACRAGTTTPFSFGGEVTREQVNYRGPRTVPAKSLPPNSWGLFEMHANVLEWCADGTRDYAREPAIDPTGPMQDFAASRAARGGSWIGNAGLARSAYRDPFTPGYRFENLGFRLCSRSSKSGPAQSERDPEGRLSPRARSLVAPRDEARRVISYL